MVTGAVVSFGVLLDGHRFDDCGVSAFPAMSMEKNLTVVVAPTLNGPV